MIRSLLKKIRLIFTIVLKDINGKLNKEIYRSRKMLLQKSKQFKVSTNKSKFDQFLWFIENYFPQKKGRGFKKNSLWIFCKLKL